jgi:hypothetical protein
MSATITPTSTLGGVTELGGKYKILHLTATISSADDAFTLTEAAHKITAIDGIISAVITGGMGANFQSIEISYSSLTVTIVSKNAAGSAATDFTSTTVALTLLVH